ncbi:MAG: hypothetical protein PF503_10950 [Desulfobacula sp.]|jgi:hypothetical protein|nr:hypothetical protein [Desulfobacula sp.]
MSIFKNGFEEPKANFPEQTILNAIKDFDKITQGLATLGIYDLNDFDKITSGLKTTFQFELLLTSKFLDGYSFKIFSFGYDVSLYPVILNIESEISEEMGNNKPSWMKSTVNADNEEFLLKLINEIFTTKKFKQTVGGLMKIARSKVPK